MKKEIEISGKTREEAIEKAVIELGAPSASAIMYTVINEGRKGFLGFGAVDCTIRAVSPLGMFCAHAPLSDMLALSVRTYPVTTVSSPDAGAIVTGISLQRTQPSSLALATQ